MKGGENVVLLHIRDALQLVLEYAEEGKSRFLKDTKTQDAILRRLEIIGEAAKRLPDAFRNRYAEIPWRRIAGFRDVGIHHYDRLDMQEIWRIVEREAPALLQQVRALLTLMGEKR